MITLENMTKYYKVNGKRRYIFKNVNCQFPEGNIALIGRNGAGKSTLMRMLGGVDFPDSGRITIKKRISWPIGLSGGFQGSMTARDNVKFVSRVFGKREEKIAQIIEYVQDFAEVGDYFDMPMNVYSSGMRSRVAFGLSMAFDFEIYLADEITAVGDENFRRKSAEVFREKLGRSHLIMSSHDMGTLKKMCDCGVVVDRGELLFFDDVKSAIDYYKQIQDCRE